MNRAHVFLVVGMAAVVAGGPALAAEPCLMGRGIVSYKTLDRHTLIVRATGGKRFRLDLGGTCIGLDNVITLGVKTRGGGLCVETGDSIVYSFSGFGEQSCLITGVSIYNPKPPGEPEPSQSPEQQAPAN